MREKGLMDKEREKRQTKFERRKVYQQRGGEIKFIREMIYQGQGVYWRVKYERQKPKQYIFVFILFSCRNFDITFIRNQQKIYTSKALLKKQNQKAI